MQITTDMDLLSKLNILSASAKYDVACISSGVDRNNDGSGTGNCIAPGICHTFSGDGRCVSLLKILFTNECIFNCSYCINRRDNDIVRASFTPDEVCRLTMEFYRRNYIEGLFLSSGILVSPNYTMDLLYQTLLKLRREENFQGYIHVKAIPGADAELIRKVGFLADRMSVNLELPTKESLTALAPNKNRRTILSPMRQIQQGITTSKNELMPYQQHPQFVPAGQSTQMIIGATKETDYQILSVAEKLYQNFSLKRVFYSAFMNVNMDSSLPMPAGGPPLLREHRLYQADFLLRYYRFSAEELLSEEKPNFNVFLDPKCDWAIRHLELYPVEVTTANYNTLLRVPGIGVTSAKRIMAARRQGQLSYPALKKMGVVLKRALFFITLGGRQMYPTRIEEDYILRNLLSDAKAPLEVQQLSYRQLSLFDDMMLESKGQNDVHECLQEL